MPRIWINFGGGLLVICYLLLFVICYRGKVKSTNLSWVKVGLGWVGLEFGNIFKIYICLLHLVLIKILQFG